MEQDRQTAKSPQKDEDGPDDPGDSRPKDAAPDKTSDLAGSSEPKSPDVSLLVTVFHNSKNFTVKHPLMHKWTLWFTKPLTPGQRANTTDAWADSLKEVITFDSVEEFWGLDRVIHLVYC